MIACALRGLALAALWSIAAIAQDRVRFLSLDARFTKETTSFQVKNLFAFRLPEHLPAPPNFRGLVGSLSTTTHQAPDASRPVGSETLFGLAVATTSACPVWGEQVDGYPDLMGRFPNQFLATAILKQSAPGTSSYNYNFILPVGIPMRGTCVFLSFDGTDFAGQPYTMASNLRLMYDTSPTVGNAPYSSPLDMEFSVSPYSDTTHPLLTTYKVVPIGTAGRLLSLYGDISAVALPAQRGLWHVRHITALYTKGSCAKVFPNHADGPFNWNDTSLSVFAPTSTHLADVTLSGTGPKAVNSSTVMAPVFPVAVAPGDCLVQAILPSGDGTTSNDAANTEVQLHVERVDD